MSWQFTTVYWRCTAAPKGYATERFFNLRLRAHYNTLHTLPLA